MPDGPPSHTAGQTWSWAKTDDPSQQILVIYIQSQLILNNLPTREVLANGANPYVPPSQFKDLTAVFKPTSIASLGVNDWYYIGNNIGNPTSELYYFKNKTTAEVLTPYDTDDEIGDHHWPMVVLDVWPETDYTTPVSYNVVENGEQGIITGPRVTIHSAHLDAIDEGTLFITRKYLSATKPPLPSRRIPQPLSMRFVTATDEKEFPPSLHNRIIFGPTRSGTAKLITGVYSEAGGSRNAQIYEATNFITRKPYILSFKPVRDGYGLWNTTTVEVRPPKILQQPIIR